MKNIQPSKVSGSHNLHVALEGFDPVSKTRFQRKELVSIFVEDNN